VETDKPVVSIAISLFFCSRFLLRVLGQWRIPNLTTTIISKIYFTHLPVALLSTRDLVSREQAMGIYLFGRAASLGGCVVEHLCTLSWFDAFGDGGPSRSAKRKLFKSRSHPPSSSSFSPGHIWSARHVSSPNGAVGPALHTYTSVFAGPSAGC
jgi:hypothetical protein